MSNRISPEHMAEIEAMTRGVLPSQLLGHIAALEADVTLYRDRLAAVATEREALETENERLKALACADYWGCPIPGMIEANDWLKAENERLRAVRDVVGDFIRRGENRRTWRNLVKALSALEAEVGE